MLFPQVTPVRRPRALRAHCVPLLLSPHLAIQPTAEADLCRSV